jgi:uncharacterized membrane protein YfcA
MNVLYIPIVAILMPLILVPTTIFMRHRQQRRKWEHLERMRAMEAHSPLPMRHALGKIGGISAIGAGVPSVSVFAALLTTLLNEPLSSEDSVAVPAVAWGCALLISVGAMLTSLKLASMEYKAWKEPMLTHSGDDLKPQFDPDAFDVVSSRA